MIGCYHSDKDADFRDLFSQYETIQYTFGEVSESHLPPLPKTRTPKIECSDVSCAY